MPTLNWIGKDKVVNHHLNVPFYTLEHQYGFRGDYPDDKSQTNSGNMIIHGDNLIALKALLPEYEGRVDCIYIDPPYNTGNEEWVYNDNVNDPRIKKWLGEIVGKQGEDLSRDDKWLCMMYPRLRLLHRLLSDNGAFFVSIDFHEQPVLRLLCDEIFGANNFIAEIACVNKPSGRSDDKYIATAHESIVIYKKSDSLELGGFAPEENVIKRYTKKDSNGKLYREEDLRKRGTHDERSDRPNLFYPFFYNPKTEDYFVGNNEDETPLGYVRILPMKSATVEGTWRWGQDTARASITKIHPKFMPAKSQWTMFEWQYLDERDDVKPTTCWNYKDVNSERGTELLYKLMGFDKKVFPNPKPLGTLYRIVKIATKENSIILDSFAGSGTTAHAILKLNKEDGGQRKFILIEMMSYAETVTSNRVQKAILGYGETEGLGGSFDYYELGQPLFIGKNLNEEVDEEKIRHYIYYTETRQPLRRERKEDSRYLLDTYQGTGYYFYYERDSSTELAKDTLDIVTEKASQYVIYADVCRLPKDFMAENHIIFKRIPRDIKRF